MPRSIALFLLIQFFFVGWLGAQDVRALPTAPGGNESLVSPVRPLTEIFLSESIRGDFSPQQVFFLLSFDGQEYSRHQALLIPPFEPSLANKDAARSQSGGQQASVPLLASMRTWRAGVRAQVPEGARQLSYAVLVAAEGSRFSLFPPRTLNVHDPRMYGGSTASLRAALLARKDELRSKLAEAEANEAELRRLRADADMIADLGRIVEVREEVNRIKLLVAGLKQDQENLSEFVKIAKLSGPPRNYMARERQLTKQNTALADLAKVTENQEFSRRNESERELQHKLATIERAKDLDVELLRAELRELKAQAVFHERSAAQAAEPHPGAAKDSLPPVAESPDDYLR